MSLGDDSTHLSWHASLHTKDKPSTLAHSLIILSWSFDLLPPPSKAFDCYVVGFLCDCHIMSMSMGGDIVAMNMNHMLSLESCVES